MIPECPAGRPLLIWDGRCGFCRIWIDYFRQRTTGRIDYAASQDVAHQFPQIPSEAFGKSVQLVRPDGTVASGARAVFETLGLERVYESVPLLAPIGEHAYRFIASHRDLFYWITRLTFGTNIQPARFARVQWLFLRLLAVIYAIAFASLAVQVTGLIGAHGIAPVADYLARVKQAYGTSGYYELPSLFWIAAGNAALQAAAWAGAALALVLLFGRFERAALIALWALYLSYTTAGQVFFSYQWDALLLEAGFLAIFFGRSPAQQKLIAWLYRLLVFRLFFLSGWVKLNSGDPNWPRLTALDFHFHTQPLPNLIAWYVDQLPPLVLHASNFGVLAIELAVPFLIFGPTRWRKAAAWTMLALQALIFSTGNYTFFNLLTAALLLFLFDDRDFPSTAGWKPSRRLPTGALPKLARVALALAISIQGLLHILRSPYEIIPAQFMLVNSYGLFAVMTTTRPEIILEGSADGEHWLPYEFPYKPGDVLRAPRQAAPHQPRLDWQMWFAALDDIQSSPWFMGLTEQILSGSPDVLALFQSNPFPTAPPRYVRALLYDYTFTTRSEHARTGAWWRRTPRGAFLPTTTLRQ